MQVFFYWTIKADAGCSHKAVHVKISVESTHVPNQEKWRQEWQSLVVLNGTKIFLNGTNISFLKFICGILNWGVANSFWNHVIQISSRQMYFQDIYSSLWKVKVFIGNIYSLKSNTYFWGTVMFVQDGFLYLIVTKLKLTVHHLTEYWRTKRSLTYWIIQFLGTLQYVTENVTRDIIYDVSRKPGI
jgi:hypothetical protein